MRDFGLRLEKLGISSARYRELEYFCLQYAEKRTMLAALCGPRALQWQQAAGGETGPGDPTLAAVTRRERLLRDVEDIETSARLAAGDMGEVMARHLLSYVTRRDKPPIDLLPCGRRQFFEMRRRFFCALHARREQ